MSTVGSSARASVGLPIMLLAVAVLAGGCWSDDGDPAGGGGAETVASASSAATVSTAPPETTPVPVAESTVPPVESPPETSPPTVVTTTLPPVSKEWTLLAGGDVLMDRTEPLGVDPFASIEPALASADLAVVNSEMAISYGGVAVDKKYVFRAPPSAALRIASAGVDVVSLANNHAMDFGPAALVDTIDLLETAGVVAVGAGVTAAEAYRYRILRTEGEVSVAFVGVSMVVPRGFPAGPDSPGIASARPPSRSVDSVWEAAGVADVVIALVHWGVERTTCPVDAQREFARQLLASGADAVIGHHPHVLQPVEFIDGRLVAYSLGNFIWHPRWGITGETGVLQIDFDGDRIVGWTFHPHLLDENGAPVPVSEGGRFDRIRDIIAGDCSRHQPPPPETTTTSAPTSTTGEAVSTTEAGVTDDDG